MSEIIIEHTTNETLAQTEKKSDETLSNLGKRKNAEPDVLDENSAFSCKEHAWQKAINCQACKNDADTVWKKMQCKVHEYGSLDCDVCKKQHHMYHIRFHPALYDCGTCQRSMERNKREEAEKRKREGIEKRKRTMAAKKLAKRNQSATQQ